jgi:hypothetical protein
LARDLTALRYTLVKAGVDIDSFHACEDLQATRDAVVALVRKHTDWHFASIVIGKPKLNPAIRDQAAFYPKFASMVLRFVFKGRIRPDTSQVLIHTDTLPVGKQRAAVEASIKKAAHADLGGVPFCTFHHARASNAWLQVADYCSWAVYRRWEKKDDRTYLQLWPFLAKTELNVTDRGDGTVYY